MHKKNVAIVQANKASSNTFQTKDYTYNRDQSFQEQFFQALPPNFNGQVLLTFGTSPKVYLTLDFSKNQFSIQAQDFGNTKGSKAVFCSELNRCFNQFLNGLLVDTFRLEFTPHT